jgi:15-cis-phytoene synthase
MMSHALVPVAPAQLARHVIAHHSKSFALASRLLPPRARDEVAVLYAWCRRADDTVDEGPADHDPAARLAQLGDELARIYAGTSLDPLLAAFGTVARTRGIPRSYPEELLAGMAMDVAGTHYLTVDDLFVYAWRVAGVVGLMMTHVLGVTDDDAVVPAAHLGIAMQLTNVCRDVAEDWQRGRLYVPDELLARHGAAGLAGALGGPLPPTVVAPLAGAVRELLELADRYYHSADRGIRLLPWRAAFAVRGAREVYAAIGRRIERASCDVTAGRAIVPRAGKLARIAGAALYSAAEAPHRFARSFARRRHVPPARILELAHVPRL